MTSNIARHLGGLDLRYSGYQVNAADMFKLGGVEILAAGAGVWIPAGAVREQIRATDGRFTVIRMDSTGEPYTTSFKYHAVELFTAAKFIDVIEWLKSNGKLSEPGGGPNVWD